MRREPEADGTIDALDREWRRGALARCRARRRSFRRSCRPRRVPPSCRAAPCAVRALGLLGERGLRCLPIAAALPGLRDPVDQVAVLVEHHGGTAEHRRPLAGKPAEPLAFEQNLLAPDVLDDDLVGQRQAVAGALAGADDLGDDRGPRWAGSTAWRDCRRGSDRRRRATRRSTSIGMKDIERRPLEHRRGLDQRPCSVRFLQDAALDEDSRSSAAR